jgi:hypothetical protein
VRHGLKVIRPNAIGLATQMIEFQPVWNATILGFPHFSINEYLTALGVSGNLRSPPNPADGFETSVDFDPSMRMLSVPMPEHESHRLSLYPSASSVRLWGQRCLLPTSALTQLEPGGDHAQPIIRRQAVSAE